MPSSKVDIVNMALAKLGVERISSFSDNVKAARLAADLYDLKRDEALSAHSWDFALERATLALLTEQAPFGALKNQFNLPADFLRIVALEDDRICYKIEGSKILSDARSMKILYVKRETDTTKYTPLFTNALACLIASELAVPLVQSADRGNDLLEAFDKAISLAKSHDSVQGTPDDIIIEGWTTARTGRQV